MQELIISNERLKAQLNERERLVNSYSRQDYSVIILLPFKLNHTFKPTLTKNQTKIIGTKRWASS